MAKFKDTKGDEWAVDVTVAVIKRVRSLTGRTLTDLVDFKSELATAAQDPVMLCDLLYATCKPQADERQISDEEFGGRLAGDAFGDATAALLQAVVDFFHDPQRRATLTKLLGKARETESAIVATAAGKVEALDPIKMAAALTLSTSSSSATSTPG